MSGEAMTRVEMMGGSSRCRRFTTRGRQCRNWTCRTVVLVRPDRPDFRQPDCGRHEAQR